MTTIVTSLEKTVERVESENSDASDVDEVIEIVSKFCNNFGVLRYSRNVLKTSLRVTVLLWSSETRLSDSRSNC